MRRTLSDAFRSLSLQSPPIDMGAAGKSILILAGDSDGNIGDRAIVYATCQELKRLDPAVRITVVSGNPEADARYFGVDTIARGPKALAALVRRAMASDLVLCGGGGLFQDDASLVKMPYWALRVAFVRCLARRIIGYSIGVGPLDWRSSRLAARLAFACMEQISVRDDLAKAISESLTSKPVLRVPDPALMLSPAPQSDALAVLEQAGVPLDGSPIVGVAVRRWFHHRPTVIPHKHAVKYGLRKVPGREDCKRMISLLGEVLDRVVEERGAYILFMPTYNVSHEADDHICEHVAKHVKSERKTILRISDPTLYKAITAHLKVMLSGRMHAAILSAAMGTPVVGLSYNQKFEGFFRLIGREEDVIGVENFVAKGMTEELTERLSEKIVAGDDASPIVNELIKDTRRFLARMFELDPLRHGRVANGRGKKAAGVNVKDNLTAAARAKMFE